MNSFNAVTLVGCTLTCLSLASSGLGAGADIKHSGLSSTPIVKFGPLGGIHAYALGSNTCNVGNASLAWTNNGTPGLAMNAYRLHNGRFEQIGLGNAKTACCVANNSSALCCTPPTTSCCSPSGFGLRPGCMDTYSANFNAGQGRLAPRSYMNPQTGVIDTTYPHNTGDAIYRRLQIRQTDMEPAAFPGALYFVEGHYICTEDAAANNDLNNVSHSRVTVGASFALTPAGAFNIGTPAIYAWPENQARVRLNEIDVANDGRLVLACTFANLGNGQWHYEYALYNMNSDRAVQAFSVPVPDCVNVTNIGFHDVDYHGGEPYAPTDWTATHSNGVLKWATQTFAQNVNANALRWGTLYNFRFDADAAPHRFFSSLDLFKPGTPASMTSVIWAPQPCPADMAPNDMGDGMVDSRDLLRVITSWGHCESFEGCFADIAPPGGDNQVNADDLIALLNSWGQCPNRVVRTQ